MSVSSRAVKRGVVEDILLVHISTCIDLHVLVSYVHSIGAKNA